MLSSPPNVKLLWQQYRTILLLMSLVIGIYFFTRLTSLTLLPIFADEAIYIRWAQVMRAEPTLRFLPLTDGKQPLFMWLMIPFLKTFSDPLLTGRLVSVFAGFGSTVGMFFLGRDLASKLLKGYTNEFKEKTRQVTSTHRTVIPYTNWVGLITSLLYCLVPYSLFFDRMALVDSLLAMFGIWAMVFALQNIFNPRLDLSILTGGALGLAWLTKSPAMFLLTLVPALGITQLVAIKKQPWLLARLVISWAITFGIALAMYNLLHLGPEFHQIHLRNQDYIYPLAELQVQPFKALTVNLPHAVNFYWKLLTPGVVLMAAVGSVIIFKLRPTIALWLLGWWWVPTLTQAAIARDVNARYFLYTVPAVLILSAVALVYLWSTLTKHRVGLLIAGGLMLAPIIWFDFTLITNPQLAPLPTKERQGYLEEWTAGTGLREVAAYLENQAQDSSIVVGTEGYFGTLPHGLQIYFDKHPHVTIIGQPHIIGQVGDNLYHALDQNQVYLVVNDTRLNIENPKAVGLELINAYPKAVRPDGTYQSLLFFQVMERPETEQ